MTLAINRALTLNATSKDTSGKVIANFYANVGVAGTNNSLQMTIVDRDLFVANRNVVTTDLQTFITSFMSNYSDDVDAGLADTVKTSVSETVVSESASASVASVSAKSVSAEPESESTSDVTD